MFKNKKLKIINLYAGPGAGKSTTAAGLFFLMKSAGESVELITEYAKEKVYDGFLGCLEDQIYIFGKQQRRAKRLVGSVEYAITDSPLLLSVLYNKDLSHNFESLVKETYYSYTNLDFFINRVKPYIKIGRHQEEYQAISLDIKLRKLLLKEKIELKYTDGDSDAPQKIYDMIKRNR